MYVSPAYRLRLYRDFKALAAHDYIGLIRYYERHEEALHGLDLDQFLDCTLAYTQALSETGDFRRHIVMCEYLLGISIRENIVIWGGENLYHRLLYEKALSHRFLQEWEACTHALTELLKMDPRHPSASQLLYDCLMSQPDRNRDRLRSLGWSLAIVFVLFCGFTLIIFEPFWPQLANPAQMFCVTLGAASAAVFLYGEGRHWKRVRTATGQACRMRGCREAA